MTNPQSPTPEDEPVVIGEPDYIKGPVVLVPGCNLPNRVAPSQTLQTAAEGAVVKLRPYLALSQDATEARAIILRHFSFVEELEKQRNAAMADYDRVALTNAELRIDLARACAERDDLSKVAAERLEWHTESRRQRDTARQEASELRGCGMVAPADFGASSWADLKKRLAAADEMAEALKAVRDYFDGHGLHPANMAIAALSAYQTARTKGGAGA